jgi:hypothetical protein
MEARTEAVKAVVMRLAAAVQDAHAGAGVG